MVTRKRKPDGGTPCTGKWLLMFFVAGDNNLSALFVDQLKALKDAGFAKNVEVIVRFDPNEPDIKTRIFNVNRQRKLKPHAPLNKAGDGRDPFVRNMIEDLEKAAPDNITADHALDRFIGDCLREYEADHHMLFLLGHGLIVGNDAFLPDELPKSGIGLNRLGAILREHFEEPTTLELLGLQACAMSGIEVLYELQGTAKYMLASEGLSFVNGWPYRQLIKRFLNGIRRKEWVEKIIDSLYWLTFFNAKDFLLAGFPLELSLINLDRNRIKPLTPKVQNLVRLLKKALRDQNDPAPTDAIQLAHLKSQSYFDEFYTDLYDFCLCLQRQCENNERLTELGNACHEVTQELEPARSQNLLRRFKALVIHANHFGWRFQYSHGLSILFPWVEPRRNVKVNKQVMRLYKRYAFTRHLKPDSWFSFLEEYFKATERPSRDNEDGRPNLSDVPKRFRLSDDDRKDWSEALDERDKPTGASEKPTGGSDSSTCECPSIKNFPRDDNAVVIL